MLIITFGAAVRTACGTTSRKPVAGLASPSVSSESCARKMSEQELQSILDNSNAVIYVKDTDGRYLRINRRFEDLFGVSRTEVFGKTDYDLFPREMADRYHTHDQEVMRVAQSLEFEEIASQEDGLQRLRNAHHFLIVGMVAI